MIPGEPLLCPPERPLRLPGVGQRTNPAHVTAGRLLRLVAILILSWCTGWVIGIWTSAEPSTVCLDALGGEVPCSPPG